MLLLNRFSFLSLFLCLTIGSTITFATDDVAKDPALKWEGEMKRFAAMDEKKMPEKNGILFVGSSSIRMWDTDTSFPDLDVTNRGFGGSQTSDVLYHFDKVVKKYEPRKIVFYCGDNDIAKGKTPQKVICDFKVFMKLVYDELPEGTMVYYLPIKPSQSRWKMWEEMNEVNMEIKKFADQLDQLEYVDTATVLLNDEGKPRDDIFMKDGLHLNETGYGLWNPVVKKALTE